MTDDAGPALPAVPPPATPPAALREAVPPWLLLSRGTAFGVWRQAWDWRAGGLVCRVLRGPKMRTEQASFDELAAALQFPEYFGENWDAVLDCLTDLDWLPDLDPSSGQAFVLVVTDADQVLADEPAERLSTLLGVLEAAAGEWACPVQRGEGWDRPAVAAHVVLQVEPGREAALRERLAPHAVADLRAPAPGETDESG